MGIGRVGYLNKDNADYMKAELDKLTNDLLDSTKMFYSKLNRRRQLLPILERHIDEILQEIKLKGNSLEGRCPTCLNEHFCSIDEIKNFKKQLIQIPWSKLDLETPIL